NYTADTNGSVTNASETIHAVSGKPQGSTATASNGYHFVNWTNEAGEVVSTDAAYVPVKVNGLHVAATYTAHFAANTPTPTDPTPDPTPGTPTTTTPTATTAVLGEALAPVQPEVGVLGEALAPEVGVLGEAKGPGTGDTAPIAGWSFLIMGAILTLGVTAKRRKKEEE
uniref:InlB B-repeat-containing protein n=1 Tax=Eisenbergiella sp. OF01-20 TaxID=2292348 RepID=UPI000FF3550D